jgi:hypothetical protein
MGEVEGLKHGEAVRTTSPNSSPSEDIMPRPTVAEEEEKKTFMQKVLTPGSVWQIIFAAILAIAIGLAVTTTVDEVPDAAITILAIPGNLWLRALRAVGMSSQSLPRCAG